MDRRGRGRGQGRGQQRGRGAHPYALPAPAPRQNAANPQLNNGEDVHCQVCNGVLRVLCSNVFRFLFDVKKWSEASKKGRQKYLNTFLTMVNTLYNEGGGHVLIHSEQLYVAFFHEQVDNRLMDLIPDGAMFDERFRKSSVDDKHISLQVMPPSQRPRPLSFLNFHSTISLHKGRAKPDYLQMKHLLMRRHPQPTLQPSPFSNQRLVKDQVFPFTETRSLQAKVAMEKDLRNARGDSTAEKLLNLCWEGLDLPDFISGFSKQQEGGSYCVGIQEDKEKTGQRWLPVEGTEGLCQLLGMEMKLWKDKDNPNVLYLARDEHVPPYENRTGNYILRGVCLTRDEQLKFESLLTDRITSGMSLYPVPAVDSPPLVECLFHPVLELVDGQQIHKDLCVVEIRVRYFQGVCFQNAEGPEAYRYVRRLNPSRDPVRVSCDECCMNLIHSTLHL